LEASQQNGKEKSAKIVDLEQHIKELKARYDEKVLKMEAQLAQQNKLIIFLQSKNESCKKKRVGFLFLKVNLILF
jgi:peptidoglycan hydrolase CwlO-like protein